MLRETGSIRVMVGSSGSGVPNDNIVRAVASAVVGEYELLGEVGRGVAGTIMYLAREVDSSLLVVLRLDPAPSGDDSVLTVVRELEPGILAAGQSCPECGAPLVGWGRFCPHCGADLLGSPDENGASASAASRTELTTAARQAAAGKYDILGTMPRAGAAGAGMVHFAHDVETGKLVALSLRDFAPGSGSEERASFRLTQVLRPLDSTAAAAAPPARESAAEAERSWARPLRAQPTPHRSTPQAVLIPTEDASPGESLPPRPVRGGPPWWITPAVIVVAAVVALAAFVKARASMPDGTEARLGSGGMGVAIPAADAPARIPTPDSAHVRIEASLPEGAEITVNGATVTGESLALPPGEYVLAASAPGHVSVSETLALEAGQTLIWTPTLAVEAAPRPTPPPARRASSSPPEQKAEAAEPSAAPPKPAPESCASSYDAKNWSVAATLCAAEARAGNVAAQRNLGVMYDRGVGVERDPAQAAVWLRKAGEAGSRDAAYQLGTMYESGRGVEEDAAQAAAWYGKAALLGDRDAQVKLGKAYEQGAGVPLDMGEALTWYRKAADQGDAWAQNYIGYLYGNGKGVRHDDAEALRWFRRSAAAGNAQAEYNVGFMYANGRGVARSESEAVRWYRRAAQHGYAEAAKELERRGITP